MPDRSASGFLDRNCDLDQHRARSTGKTRGWGATSGRVGGQQEIKDRALVPVILRRPLHLLLSPRALGLQPQGGSHPPPPRPPLVGQAPARPSGWARPQQRCPRQRWAPWKAGCQLDSLWASDGPPGRTGWEGWETREERVLGKGTRQEKRVVSSPVLAEGRLGTCGRQPGPTGGRHGTPKGKTTPTSLLLALPRG